MRDAIRCFITLMKRNWKFLPLVLNVFFAFHDLQLSRGVSSSLITIIMTRLPAAAQKILHLLHFLPFYTHTNVCFVLMGFAGARERFSRMRICTAMRASSMTSPRDVFVRTCLRNNYTMSAQVRSYSAQRKANSSVLFAMINLSDLLNKK